MANLKNQLNFLKGEVLEDEATLKFYSRDASLFEIKPQIVVFPKDVDDIKNLVVFVNKNLDQKIHLTPRSAGSDMTGGPLGESIVVEFTKYFNHIKKIGDNYALTEPGVFYRDFEKETLKHNLLLPSYPASREICAVGGMAANNAGGEKTLAYGKTEKYIEELKVVLSDGNEYQFSPLTKSELEEKIKLQNFEGEIYRKIYKLAEDNYDAIKKAKPEVSKNSAGYLLWDVWDRNIFDLTKLFVGSQGTLGIITEIKFKLVKPKTHSKLLVIFLKDIKPLAEIVSKVLKHRPESFESYDDNTLKLVIRFLPEFVELLRAKNIFSLAWQFLPEFWTILTSGFPKLILLAEFTGDSIAEVDEKIEAAKTDLQSLKIKMRATRNEKEARKYWVMRRESFNLLRHHIRGLRTAPFIDDFVVKPEKLPEFLPKLNQILSEYSLIYTVAGHVGDGNFHIIPLMNLADPKSRKIIPELSEKVYRLVLDFGGSITAEHNDGLIRGSYLKAMYGDKIYKLFKEVKNIFDPNNIFNPGKKVDANMEYALSHLDVGSK
ncbi:MAG TPA: FAD-binding oxidoreductase [Patescibacteria group bacterium]|nr:FAD-binding oxidoreductase [Patescibacteria group bacterium]